MKQFRVIVGKTTKKSEMTFPAKSGIEIKLAFFPKLSILLLKKKHISLQLKKE